MGVINLPRASFSGFTFWNPSTMNNNDQQPSYDPSSATLNWSWLERHGLRDETDFDRYVTTIDVLPQANDVINVGVDTTAPPAEWNFYGDNTCGFVQPDQPRLEWPAKFTKPSGGTTVTGFTNDALKRVAGGDPWIGLPVQLNVGMDGAKLVDVDPLAPWSSQLFVDTVSLGSPDGPVGFTGATAGRAHSRWVFFARNLNLLEDIMIAGVASAMWQLALPARGLTIRDASPKAGSLAAQVVAALQQPGVLGLMVRFVTYHTVYFQGPEFAQGVNPDWKPIVKLYAEYATALAKYEQGVIGAAPPKPVNRAYSNTVGWIAPWTTSDMRSAATGRLLYNLAPVQPANTNLAPLPLGPAALEYALEGNGSRKVSRVALDLGSTIPEQDSTLVKVDFGELQLALAPDGTAGTTIFAKVPHATGYDKGAYEAAGGVVDIPASRFVTQITDADLRRGIQVLFPPAVPGGQRQVGLEEAEYTAETDDRGVYVEEPGARWSPPDPSVVVQVRRRGAKPPPGTQLRIAQYAPWTPGFNEMSWKLVSTTPGELPSPFAGMNAGAAVVDGGYVIVPVPTVDDGLGYSAVTLGLSGLRPGPALLQFSAAPTFTPPRPSTDLFFPTLVAQMFGNVRVLPFHNAMAEGYVSWLLGGPSVDLATQRVWDAVFRTFALMYPAMRFIRDPLQFQAQRGRILAITDPALFERASYMPVTRPLSAGQRAMLEAWRTYLDGKVTHIQEAPLGRRG